MSDLRTKINLSDEEILLVLNVVKYHSSFLQYGDKWYLQTEYATENPAVIKALRKLLTED